MKSILITGSNSDIGIAVAKALAGRECRLGLHYYSNKEKTKSLAACLKKKGIEYRLFQADLTVPANAKVLIGQAVEQFGRLDVLINLVGPFLYKSILDITPEEWLTDIDLNLHTCFHTSHFALNELRRTQGHIINFAFSGVDNIKDQLVISPSLTLRSPNGEVILLFPDSGVFCICHVGNEKEIIGRYTMSLRLRTGI